MSTGATPPLAASDRSDFRTVLTGGTKVGVLTGVAVVLYLAVSRLPDGLARGLLQAAVVLAAGTGVGFLPARWTAARRTEGIAGAAAMGLWGTVVFMAIDIVLLRPFKAYPWTWDAVGGGSTWWYLPLWWMLGTFLAWMGAMVTAGRAVRAEEAGGGGEEPGLGRVAVPVLVAAVALAAAAEVAGVHVALPVAAGAGFTVSLVVFALAGLARRP